MIKNLFFVICLLLISCNQQSETGRKNPEAIHKIYFQDQKWEDAGYTLVDSIYLNIDDDKIKDTIKIYNIPNWSDPGDYHKLELILSNQDHYEIYNLGDWINLNDIQSKKFQKINKVSTDRFLITDISKNRTILVIFGYTYASSPPNLLIVELTHGNVKPLYNDLFELQELIDLDQNNIKELIGYKFYGEGCCYNDSISQGLTYMPYHILKLVDDSIITDTTLSEQYNLENYVGYFGLDYDQDMRYLTIYPKVDYDFRPYFYFEKYRKYPETSIRYLKRNELLNMNKNTLRLMRNEIFAFHGYKFNSPDLKDYFSSQDWYKPSGNDVNSRLNKYEIANINLIKSIENE